MLQIITVHDNVRTTTAEHTHESDALQEGTECQAPCHLDRMGRTLLRESFRRLTAASFVGPIRHQRLGEGTGDCTRIETAARVSGSSTQKLLERGL